MPAAEALITYLAAAAGLVEASTIMKGPMPELPDVLVTLHQYDGEPALDRTMGPSLQVPGAEVAYVQLMVRHTSNAAAQLQATALHALLDGYGPAQLGTPPVTYHNVESLSGEPRTLGQDQPGRWRYEGGYRVTKGRG